MDVDGTAPSFSLLLLCRNSSECSGLDLLPTKYLHINGLTPPTEQGRGLSLPRPHGCFNADKLRFSILTLLN